MPLGKTPSTLIGAPTACAWAKMAVMEVEVRAVMVTWSSLAPVSTTTCSFTNIEVVKETLMALCRCTEIAAVVRVAAGVKSPGQPAHFLRHQLCCLARSRTCRISIRFCCRTVRRWR